MTSTNKKWWYAAGQKKMGPYSGEELVQLAVRGTVMPETLVWKDGMASWAPASRLSALWKKVQEHRANAAAMPMPHNQGLVQSEEMPASVYIDTDAQHPPAYVQQAAWGDGFDEPAPPVEKMTLFKAAARCFKKCVIFSGRAGRAEFWYFLLFVCIVSLLLGAVMGAMGASDASVDSVGNIVGWVVFLPFWAVGSRRLHDIGKSGWWQLIWFTVIGIFVLLYWWCQKGDQGKNKYGYPE